jgi:hypothetical protein
MQSLFVERTMRSQLVAGWPGRISALGLVLLTLGIGLCLFDGDEFDQSGHASPLDLCNGFALFSFAITLLALAAVGRVSTTPAELIHPASIRRLDPPPRALSRSRTAKPSV